MNRGPFAAVIFDLDGVLTDTARYHFLAWRELASQLGISIDLAFNEQLKGVSRMDSLERILKHGGVALPQAEKERLAEQKNQHYRQLIASMSPADLLPGVVERLEALRQRDIPLALASASRNGPDILQQLGLAAFFHTVVDPAPLPGKPHPALFSNAALALACPSRHCLGVEDAAAGIAAIKAAGMVALGIGRATDLPGADHVLPDLSAFHLHHFFWTPNTRPPAQG